MQADQTVYLYPRRAELLGADAMVVGRHNYPDVVLEVDHTTDVRRGKLKLYESWGFPEVWVEVPERWVASRPRGLVPGLTIHLLEDGVYRVSPESVAFPGWRAEAIHDAMNEAERSVRTNEILEGLGQVLGSRDGTGPDDDALMRSLRGQSRAEGEHKGRAEGEKKGRATGLAEGRRKGPGRKAWRKASAKVGWKAVRTLWRGWRAGCCAREGWRFRRDSWPTRCSPHRPRTRCSRRRWPARTRRSSLPRSGNGPCTFR